MAIELHDKIQTSAPLSLRKWSLGNGRRAIGEIINTANECAEIGNAIASNATHNIQSNRWATRMKSSETVDRRDSTTQKMIHFDEFIE